MRERGRNHKKILISNTVESSKSVTIYFDGIGELDGFQVGGFFNRSEVTFHFTSELETVDKVFTSTDDLDPITIMYTNEISITMDRINTSDAYSTAEIEIVSGGVSENNDNYLQISTYHDFGDFPGVLIPDSEEVHLYINRLFTTFVE